MGLEENIFFVLWRRGPSFFLWSVGPGAGAFGRIGPDRGVKVSGMKVKRGVAGERAGGGSPEAPGEWRCFDGDGG